MQWISALTLLSVLLDFGAESFQAAVVFHSSVKVRQVQPLFMSSFAADGSEYSSKDTDYDEDESSSTLPAEGGNFDDDEEGEVQELSPVPMSKNSGNRFVALIWDQELDTKGRDVLELHRDRDLLVEDHVMFCRKRNLYNETFNSDSMVDIMRSLSILSSDLRRMVGSLMVLESSELKYVHSMLREEPSLLDLNGGDISQVQLYRWRQIRDYTLRIDDGRFGYPCMMIGLDDEPENVGNIRQETKAAVLEYMIKSERVIAGGPLHLPTEFKDDPSSIPVGDLILFNAKDRDHAIQFAEEMPSSLKGLYKDLRVHFYNNLDVTGKFVSEDPMRDAPGYQMREALEYWGYPVDDAQTPWLNW